MIDLYKLEYFVVLVREGTYVQAAQRLALSQPALSRSIQSLERHIGARLLNRSKSGVTLTAVGESFYTQAEQLLLRAKSLEDNVKLMLTGTQGEVRFGIAPASASAFLPRLLTWAQSHHPDMRIHIAIASVDEMRDQLLERDLEFFVSRERSDIVSDPRISVRALGNAGPVLYVRHGHPLLEIPDLNLEDLGDYRIASGTAWNESIKQIGRRELHELLATIEVDNYELLADLTATSDVVLVSSYADLHPRLLPLPLTASDLDIPLSTVSIFTLEGREQSPVAGMVQETLREHFHEAVTQFA